MSDKVKKRVLIIEDDPSFLKMLKMHLEKNHLQVLFARNGLDGYSKVRKVKPNLVILDLMLPGMDGHKVCHMIKSDNKLNHIPVIILTSRDLDEDVIKAEKSGADAFIVKTTKMGTVMDVVKSILEEAEAEHS